MNITKVELLWSRECPLTCVGCAMPNGLKGGPKINHQGNAEQWVAGIKNIKAMGAKFIAIYGAEPLTRYEGLPPLINAIMAHGMATTIITALPLSPKMVQLLRESALDSVTCSYDGITQDVSRKAKSASGWRFLHDQPQIRDRTVVATISSENIEHGVEMARKATEQGYWFMFDFLHEGIGDLSKCSVTKVPPITIDQMRAFIDGLLKLKEQGGKVHPSAEYLQYVRDRFEGDIRTIWHCRGQSTGWLTVDSDGDILPCDDWQKRYPRGKIWDTLDFNDVGRWKDEAVNDCPGCAWNTHFDACRIERAGGSVGSYVH